MIPSPLAVVAGISLIGLGAAYITVVGRSFERDARALLRASRLASTNPSIVPSLAGESHREEPWDRTGTRISPAGPGTVVLLLPRPTDVHDPPKRRLDRRAAGRDAKGGLP